MLKELIGLYELTRFLFFLSKTQNGMNCNLFLAIHLLLLIISISALSQSPANYVGQNGACQPDIDRNSDYKLCQCATVAENERVVAIRCAGQSWTHMPNTTTIFDASLQQPNHNVRPSIASMSLTDGSLTTLGQDVFKGENIQMLELNNNAIDSINVNAFRGLEGKLYHLNLNHNSLPAVPGWAFTYLYQLQHLHMKDNQISKLSPASFGETQLRNLRYLHLDKNKLDTLPKDSLYFLRLQVLTLSDNRITSIEKQSIPSSLWFFDLKNNLLDEIPYSGMADLQLLKTLDLEGNNISFVRPNADLEFPLNITTELELLLSNNKIQQLGRGAFNSFSKFGKLDLSYNQISNIDENAFETIVWLSHLDLSYNSIVHIPHLTFSRFAGNMKRLNLEENNLHSVPMALKPLQALEYLNMNSNKLGSLDDDLFSNFKANLSELFLAFNRLTKIPSVVLQGMHRLQHLDLSKNKIAKIDKMAFGSYEGGGGGSVSLVKLNLAGNQILEVVDPGSFLYMSQLTYLDLSFNRIKRLTSFQWLAHLERVSLSRNRIHTLNAKTFHSTSAIQVKWLNLAHNRISNMHTSAFENLPNLEQLLLNNNQLTTLQPQILSSLKNLRQLSLAHNQINETQESAFANLPQLEKLSLSYNRLRTMKEGIFHRVTNLAQLDLSHNRIEAFDLDFMEENVQRLKWLDLSHNVIRKLEISQARHSLIQLHVQNNQLEFIDNKMLQGFEKLLSVDLSHNDLIEVEANAFWKSHNLRKIILSDNNLRVIWKETFSDQILIHTLDLGNNVLNSIDAGVFGTNNVVELNLSQNNFTSVPSKALSTIQNSLAVLDLSHNSIRTLNKDDFRGLVNVTKLVLSFNRLESLEEETFEHLRRLKYLDISNNPVTAWSPNVFTGLSPSIEFLNLAATGLFSLPKLNTKGLKTLNISNNKIYELYPNDVESLKKLLNLDLADNNLLDLKSSVFEKLQDLRHLNLSGNGVRILQPEHFKYLDQIYDMPEVVNYNITEVLSYLPPLKSLHFECKDRVITASVLAQADVRLLRQLTVSGEKVEEIDSSAFERLRGFRLDLSIEHTRLRKFPSTAFQSMSSVSYLNLGLAHNNIETLNPFESSTPPLINQHGTILESITLEGNPLVCDCRLEWLSLWMDYNSADNTAQWAHARKLLSHAKCFKPMNDNRENSEYGDFKRQTSSHQSDSLLEIYDTSPISHSKTISSVHHYYGENGKLHNGNQVSWMVCDSTGRLISGVTNSKDWNWNIFIVVLIVWNFARYCGLT
ncbi:leucine rich repeat domain-containing protein [Ditylenchus destructor]|nr:leucine rich repeat domain-containing protein [Ditylenchus destructor]